MCTRSENQFVCIEWAAEACQNRCTDMGADEDTRVSVNHEVNSRRNMIFGEIRDSQRSVAEKVWRKWVDVKISSASIHQTMYTRI